MPHNKRKAIYPKTGHGKIPENDGKRGKTADFISFEVTLVTSPSALNPL